MTGAHLTEAEKNLRRDSDIVARLMASIDKQPDGCWLWTGTINDARGGYGQTRVEGRSRRAHRVVYERLVGPIPAGLELDHLCVVPRCVRPDHLEPVTAAENRRRRSERLRQRNKCSYGHPWTPENLLTDGPSKVRCRTCTQEQGRRRTAANRRSHCRNGHPYQLRRDGHPFCPTCISNARKQMARPKAVA